MHDSVPHSSNMPPYFLSGQTSDDHRLAIPVKPCRGVEDIASVSDCGGEAIWDWAFNQAPDRSTYGVAVNPTNRRGQHQLHIHLARIQRDLQTELKKVADAGKKTFVPIECGGTKCASPPGECGQAQAVGCTVDLTKAPDKSGIVAKFVDGKDIETAVKPFASANGDTACTSLLVSQPNGPGNGYVLVHANDRAAECLLYCTKLGSKGETDCQGHCQTSPKNCP